MSERGRDYYHTVATIQGVPEDRIHPLFNGELQEFLDETICVDPTNIAVDGILRSVVRNTIYALRPFSSYIALKNHGDVSSEARNIRVNRDRRCALDRFARLHLPLVHRSGILHSLQAEVLDPGELTNTRLIALRPRGANVATVDDSEIIFRTTASLDTGRKVLRTVCVHALSVVLTSADKWPLAVRDGDRALSFRYNNSLFQVDNVFVD